MTVACHRSIGSRPLVGVVILDGGSGTMARPGRGRLTFGPEFIYESSSLLEGVQESLTLQPSLPASRFELALQCRDAEAQLDLVKSAQLLEHLSRFQRFVCPISKKLHQSSVSTHSDQRRRMGVANSLRDRSRHVAAVSKLRRDSRTIANPPAVHAVVPPTRGAPSLM